MGCIASGFGSFLCALGGLMSSTGCSLAWKVISLELGTTIPRKYLKCSSKASCAILEVEECCFSVHLKFAESMPGSKLE